MLENVSKDLLEKARKAKTKEEALAILREGGFELTDEDLNSVSGGEGEDGICWTHKVHCVLLCPEDEAKCIGNCGHCTYYEWE